MLAIARRRSHACASSIARAIHVPADAREAESDVSSKAKAPSWQRCARDVGRARRGDVDACVRRVGVLTAPSFATRACAAIVRARGMHSSAMTALEVGRKSERAARSSESTSAPKEESMGEFEEMPRSMRDETIDANNDKRALTAVHTAIGCNTAILVCKLGAYGVSG